MYRVFGRVLELESKRGIPDLVAALFDIDVGENGGLSADTLDLTHVRRSRTQGTEGAALDRIGSVLTDRFGRFEITFDEKAFRVSDAEQRPDLLLAIYAPEDLADAAKRTPAPSADRLLLRSLIPRQDAGRSEAYILRIPAADLERFQIPIPGGVAPDASALAAALLERSELEGEVRRSLRSHRQENVRRAREKRASSAHYVSSLTTVGAQQRNSPTFAHGDRTVSSTIPVAASRGLDRIREASPARAVFYRTVDEDLAAAGVSVPPPTFEPVAVTHEHICRLLMARRGGPALRRAVDLVEAERSRRARAEAGSEAMSPAEPRAEPDGDGEAVDARDAEALLAAGIREQLRELAFPEAQAATSLEELSARVAGFRLPPGPADVTAQHDFHQLQIAFEHVWVEAFDHGLRDEVRELYEEIVSLHEDVGGTFDLPAEAGEIDELGEILRNVGRDIEVLSEPPPEPVVRYWEDADSRWHLLSESQQAELVRLSSNLDGAAPGLLLGFLIAVALGSNPTELRERLGPEFASLIQDYERGRSILANPRGRLGRLVRLREKITQRLTEPYAFHYFAPNSINFGILVTYRQHWEPLGYQVGDMVSTIPLAPGESRKYSARTVRKLTRSEKELENNLTARKGESSLTRRADAAISEKASTATNFKHTSQGSISFGIGSIGAAMEFAASQSSESARAKSDFREAVIRSAHEYRSERTVEVTTSDEKTMEHTSSGEISNPNNEVTVTYLFYELERQYRLRERLHQVTPTILVAQDVPAPNEIDEAWLLEHEWILRRVLLDDSLHRALDDLRDAFAGDEVGVNVMRANWEQQSTLARKLESDVETFRNELVRLQAELVGVERARGEAEAGERSTEVDVAAAIFTGGLSLFAPDRAEEAAERLEVARKAIEMQLEHLSARLQDSESRLGRIGEALSNAAREYQEALRTQTNRRVRIDQLRVHIKQNILYYMQAIWDHEPADQRFFRLYYQEVDLPVAPSASCSIRRARPEEIDTDLPTVERFGEVYVIEGCDAPVPADPGTNTRRLVEIADLDRPLGYKGNYMIFPLRTCTYLTEYMLRDYVDGYFGLRDPDPTAGITTEELIEYVHAVWDDPSVELTEDERAALRRLVEARIRAPRRESDVVVVPTGELYAEALVGTHTLLEPFKLLHRAYDTGRARAELREAELENLRRAARLLNDDLSDPETDKTVVVSEDTDTHVHT